MKIFMTALLGVLLILVCISEGAYSLDFAVSGFRLHKDIRTMKDIKREHVVPQSLDVSCGPAGLSTLFQYYLHDPVPETEIINALLNSIPLEKVRQRRGFSLLDLKRFAESRGYLVVGYKMDIDFLKQFGKPVLAPIKFRNYRHFVIVRGVIADRVFLADPTAGNVSMKLDKFRAIWTEGIALHIEKPQARVRFPDDLKIRTTDLFTVGEYRGIKRLVDQGPIRTMTYPGEF